MKFLKDLWASWKVKITVVGGAIVIVTSYGTCTVDPDKEAIQSAVLKQSKEESEEVKKEEVAPKEEKKELPEEAKKEEEEKVEKPEEAPAQPESAEK